MKKVKLTIFFLAGCLFLVGIIWANFEAKKPDLPDASLAETPVNVKKSYENLVLSASIISRPSSEQKANSSSPIIITEDGDDLLVLINKTIRLSETYLPEDLVTIDGRIEVTKAGLLLRKEAAVYIESMFKAAASSGVVLAVGSAYRSYWEQLATFSQRANQTGLQSTQEVAARPGYSQHQLGTAVDFVLTNPAQIYWLQANASEYGFVLSYPEGAEKVTGYSYEPWHYRYIGVENAKKMSESGLILEEFLKKYGVW